ncbi:hypothetical protein [Dictyobacter kobayashii]|uniref:Uncharacterized protein n=1 Tax=Dictyobacter kobayashii TaxID=2014872 RepID=A0A402AD45_9CHLR|nr:hypothetical protein [Dictyobacter kobayashii]GCE17008.1 hypothetical protein KDK_08080 [Dictyobacter kobayashii]
MAARKTDKPTKTTKNTTPASSGTLSRRVKTIKIAVEDFILDHQSRVEVYSGSPSQNHSLKLCAGTLLR